MDKPVEEKVVEAHQKVATAAKVQERAAVETTQSTLRQEDSALRQEESADRRTRLAADRTVFAAERTYAAWMRSGLASIAASVGARTLLSDHIADWLAAATSIVLALFAMFCFVAAVWRELDGRIRPHPDVRRLPAWPLVAFSAFLVIVSAAVAIGMWAG